MASLGNEFSSVLQCKEVALTSQDEIFKVLNELQSVSELNAEPLNLET